MWITCGLLVCFYQLFKLSFWRHPFTAEDPLMSKSCNAKLSKPVLMKKQTHLYLFMVHFCTLYNVWGCIFGKFSFFGGGVSYFFEMHRRMKVIWVWNDMRVSKNDMRMFIFSCTVSLKDTIWDYIYIYAFSRRFYPKRLTVHCQYMCSLGIEPTTFALLTQCSNHWATGTDYADYACIADFPHQVEIHQVLASFILRNLWSALC